MRFLLGMVLVSVLITGCQRNLFFFPEQLPKDHQFTFNQPFTEYNIPVSKKVDINGLLFPSSKDSKGLIFFLHGNAGNVEEWQSSATFYNQQGYDYFVLDYRGFGKSGGKITTERRMVKDIQIVYDSIIQPYQEKEVIIMGFSIGTGLATQIAANNEASKLILQAPYYNMKKLVFEYYWFVPGALIKYKLKTAKHLKKVQEPVWVFHGDKDETIPVKHAYWLKEEFKLADTLVILENQLHNGIDRNPDYQRIVNALLEK